MRISRLGSVLGVEIQQEYKYGFFKFIRIKFKGFSVHSEQKGAVISSPQHLTARKDSIMQKSKLDNLEVSAIGLGCMSMSSGYGPAGDQQVFLFDRLQTKLSGELRLPAAAKHVEAKI
jgi:hypothetical protein